jgi:transcriptional regulator with XRE-family HTH domain
VTVDQGPSPELARRELAAALRLRRRAADFEARDAARALSFSTSKLSRIETGQRTVTAADLGQLCELYRVAATERERLFALQAESSRRSTYKKLVPASFKYPELEAEAVAIDDYKDTMVTSLLQTADYTRALISGLRPESPRDKIEARVEEIRMRQETMNKDLLRKDSVIIGEAALCIIVGGSGIMQGQLAHLLEVFDAGRVDLRVLPYSAGAHPAMNSVYTILSFDRPTKMLRGSEMSIVSYVS